MTATFSFAVAMLRGPNEAETSNGMDGGTLDDTKGSTEFSGAPRVLCVTVTLKLTPGLDLEAARQDVRAFLPWHPIVTDERIMQGTWVSQDRYQLSWWDALIVSAAQAADCRILLTEDFQDGQILGNLRVVNPFSSSPNDITS